MIRYYKKKQCKTRLVTNWKKSSNKGKMVWKSSKIKGFQTVIVLRDVNMMCENRASYFSYCFFRDVIIPDTFHDVMKKIPMAVPAGIYSERLLTADPYPGTGGNTYRAWSLRIHGPDGRRFPAGKNPFR